MLVRWPEVLEEGNSEVVRLVNGLWRHQRLVKIGTATNGYEAEFDVLVILVCGADDVLQERRPDETLPEVAEILAPRALSLDLVHRALRVVRARGNDHAGFFPDRTFINLGLGCRRFRAGGDDVLVQDLLSRVGDGFETTGMTLLQNDQDTAVRQSIDQRLSIKLLRLYDLMRGISACVAMITS